MGPGNDVSINTISNVQYRVDGGIWINAAASDGAFDGPVESFTFTTAPLSHGPHTIEAYAQNSVGNVDPTPASDTITIDVQPNKPATPSGETQGQTGTSYPYSTSATDPDGDKLEYGWDWDGDNVVDQWDDNGGSYYPSGTPISTSHAWSADGTYYVKVKAKDIYGAESVWSDPLTVTMPKNNLFINTWFLWFLERFPRAFPILRNLCGL